MMKPLYLFKKVIQASIAFYRLRQHPKAVRFEYRVDGELKADGLVRWAVIQAFRKEGRDFVTAFTSPEAMGGESLPSLARYWLVPKERLTQPDGTYWMVPEEGTQDLFDEVDNWRERVDDPSCVLVSKSNYDHTVWGIDGKQILLPMELTVYGSQYDLAEVAAHVKRRKEVTSFKIGENRTGQRDLGPHLGTLLVDPNRLDRGKLPKVVKRSWLQDEVVYGFSGEEHDLLGLAKLRKPQKSL